MMQFDDALLLRLGFSSMPQADRMALAARLQEELEARCGRALSEGIPEEAMNDFQAFTSGDAERAHGWLAAHYPDHESDPRYGPLLGMHDTDGGPSPSGAAIAEWAALLWLEFWRPDFRSVTAHLYEQLLAEVTAYRDRLLDQPRPAPERP